MSGPRVVALGGGHGLAASLRALRHLTEAITAVVTVADDGGSSGRLRQEYDILPPGDLRMALAALCEDTTWGHQWTAVLQHRFGGSGELSGHALGNLLIMALWDLRPHEQVRGLDLVGRLLNTRGRVLPMALEPLEIEAEIEAETVAGTTVTSTVRGQSTVARQPGVVRSVRLIPEAPQACPEALESIKLADLVVLGPGSWFTSVMPHLLVPELRRALCDTPARRILTLNVSLSDDEANGYSLAEHVGVIAAHAPDLTFDHVIADPQVVRSPEERAALDAAVDRVGASLVLTAVGSPGRPGVHDTLRLAAAYRDVIQEQGL